jgi:hypothetical protein
MTLKIAKSISFTITMRLNCKEYYFRCANGKVYLYFVYQYEVCEHDQDYKYLSEVFEYVTIGAKCFFIVLNDFEGTIDFEA